MTNKLPDPMRDLLVDTLREMELSTLRHLAQTNQSLITWILRQIPIPAGTIKRVLARPQEASIFRGLVPTRYRSILDHWADHRSAVARLTPADWDALLDDLLVACPRHAAILWQYHAWYRRQMHGFQRALAG